MRRIIFALLVGIVTEIILYGLMYSFYDASRMTYVANDLAELDKVVLVFDFLAPARLEVLFGWFVMWSIVPFVVLLVSLPLRFKLLAIVLFLPYSYFDIFSTTFMFVVFNRHIF